MASRFPEQLRAGFLWLVAALTLLVLWAAPARANRFSFLSQPTDQLGVPGYVAGTEVTPEGALYTGWAELAFRFGPGLQETSAPVRQLLDGRVPVLTYALQPGAVRYTVTVFSASVGRRPVNFVRVVLQNESAVRSVAAWGAALRYSGGEPTPDGQRAFRFVRPAQSARVGLYAQPGASFDPGAVWAFAGDAVTRDGGALLLFPRAPRGFARSVAQRPGDPSVPVTEDTPFGQVDYRGVLPPFARRQLDFVMPVVPVAPGSADYAAIAAARFDDQLRRVARYWDGLYARAVQLKLPEREVADTFYASLANMAMARYRAPGGGWVQAVNKLQYNAFWLRDAAVIANAFDLVGLHQLAAQDLDFFPSWQRDDGLLISRTDQYDGFGEALWAIGKHASSTGDRAFARRMLEVVRRALDWFERERVTEPLGMMPASTPGDNELTTGHMTGDDFWAAAGIRQAIALARLAGRGDLAQRWQGDLHAFVLALRARLAAAEAKTGGWIPPTLEATGGEDWGNLQPAYPEQVLPAGDPAVTATLQHAVSKFQEGIATYMRGAVLHGYLGFRVFETELLRGEQAAVVDGLYSELAHTTGTGGGFESCVVPGGPRICEENLAPHGTFAAEYVALLRNMLVREDGSALVLMSALPPSWLLPGREVSVQGADTARGRLSYTLDAVRGGAVLRWKATVRRRTKLRWPVPANAYGLRAPGLSRDGRTIILPRATGRIRVSWRLAGPFPTYASTLRRIMALYPGSLTWAVTGGEL